MTFMTRLLIVIVLFGAGGIAAPVMALEPICSSAGVLFCEDWETTTLPGRWADGYNPAQHQIVAFSNFGLDSWSFSPAKGAAIPRAVHFTPRITVNSVRAAAASAIAGLGLTRLYSYHVAEPVRDGRLQIVLADAEQPASPVHLLTPQGRIAVPKVRAFIDHATPRLRAAFTRIAVETGRMG